VSSLQERGMDSDDRYASEVDVDFVRKAVRAIGQVAIKIESAAERCVGVLMDLIETRVSYVVQEAVIVIKVSYTPPAHWTELTNRISSEDTLTTMRVSSLLCVRTWRSWMNQRQRRH